MGLPVTSRVRPCRQRTLSRHFCRRPPAPENARTLLSALHYGLFRAHRRFRYEVICILYWILMWISIYLFNIELLNGSSVIFIVFVGVTISSAVQHILDYQLSDMYSY